jgi:hypothetical protein
MKGEVNMKKKALIICAALVLAAIAAAAKNYNTLKPLTSEQLDYFNNEFFNGDTMNIRNQFLSSDYDDVKDIDLYELFYCGSGIKETLTNDEREKIENELSLDITKNSSSNMNAILEKYASITLDETNRVGIENFTYLPEYDAYYFVHGDTNYRTEVEISEGFKKGDKYFLYYCDLFTGGEEYKCITMKKKGDNYVFISNSESDK